MFTILFWFLLFGALANIARYIFRRATYPKEPFIHCPKCGGLIPAHNGTCDWKEPIKPKFPVGSVILLIIFLLPAVFGLFIEFTSPTPTSTPYPTATRKPTTYSPTKTICLNWDSITEGMNGRTTCVYGVVTNIYHTKETFTRIEFTDKPNSFFLYSVNSYFVDSVTGKELSPGECIQITGTIQLISHVPYIDIADSDLYPCDF